MTFPHYIDATERKIINSLLKRALAKGYAVSVYDGEEWAVKKSTTLDVITSEVAATDETTLRFRANDADARVIGSVLLVHGNGEDVISDHTDSDEINELVAGL